MLPTKNFEPIFVFLSSGSEWASPPVTRSVPIRKVGQGGGKGAKVEIDPSAKSTAKLDGKTRSSASGGGGGVRRERRS